MKALLFALLLAATPALAAPFAKGDPQTGKAIIEKANCNKACHVGQVGGDGAKIYTRPNRIVNSPKQLADRIRFCSGAAGANLSAIEEEHVAAYLNQQYYQFH